MADNDERCCTCTTPEYTIKLNKQGPQGLTGPQGEPGFSPVIEVSEDTPSSYKLSIQTEEGSYETPNLKATIPTGGYINQVLTKNSNADGDCGWSYIPYATQESTGGVQLATADDVVSGSTKAITGDILASIVNNIGDYLPSNVVTVNDNKVIQISNIKLPTHTYLGVSLDDKAGHTIIHSNATENSTHDTIGLGNIYDRLNLTSTDEIGILRGINGQNYDNYTILDSGNIGDYIPSTVVKTSGNQTISGYKTFNNMIYLDTSSTGDTGGPLIQTTVTTRYDDGFGWSSLSVNSPILTYSHPADVAQGTLRIGTSQYNTHIVDGEETKDYSAGKLQLVAPEELTRFDGTNEYTVLDSGNISQDAYIQSLVSRIEALET